VATHAEILAKLVTALDTMAAGGLVEAYTTPDGLNVQTASLADLLAAIRSEEIQSQREGKSPCHLADLRGR